MSEWRSSLIGEVSKAFSQKRGSRWRPRDLEKKRGWNRNLPRPSLLLLCNQQMWQQDARCLRPSVLRIFQKKIKNDLEIFKQNWKFILPRGIFWIAFKDGAIDHGGVTSGLETPYQYLLSRQHRSDRFCYRLQRSLFTFANKNAHGLGTAECFGLFWTDSFTLFIRFGSLVQAWSHTATQTR